MIRNYAMAWHIGNLAEEDVRISINKRILCMVFLRECIKIKLYQAKMAWRNPASYPAIAGFLLSVLLCNLISFTHIDPQFIAKKCSSRGSLTDPSE
jgi:hypothetical protein